MHEMHAGARGLARLTGQSQLQPTFPAYKGYPDRQATYYIKPLLHTHMWLMKA